MTSVEVPMLRASAAFAGRLIEASRRFGDMKYRFHRRVNWSYRYDHQFYEHETQCFLAAPDAYLAGKQPAVSQIADVFAQELGYKQVVNVMLKVCAHWLFYVLGRFADHGIRATGFTIYRKGYADDIELVFDSDEASVVRAVYPFPINLRRQLRYLRFLRQKNYRFKLAGNPYAPRDLVHFLVRRDINSLRRLEARAQVRHAYQVVALGVKTIQLSDEFDIGSLDFARTLTRFPVQVINSAHGVGKYLPVHAYQEFHVITERQAQYYLAARPCRYTLRELNDRAALPVAEVTEADSQVVRCIFLSQVFSGVSEVVASNEAHVVDRLKAEFAGSREVRLFYRPHPNRREPDAPDGFELLLGLDDVNGRPNTIFASFYSTCQIDPAFKGRKILLRAPLIYPEIVFDDSEEIINVDELVVLFRGLAENLGGHARSDRSAITQINKHHNLDSRGG